MHNYYQRLVISSKIKPQNTVEHKIVENDDNFLTLKVFPKTVSIILNTNPVTEINKYYIQDNKLYQVTDINKSSLVNGHFFIQMCDNEEYINKAWIVSNGNMELLTSYFDGTNNKLFSNNNEIKTEGTMIITEDFKIYVRIKNIWTSH